MNWLIKVFIFLGILKPAQNPKQDYEILFGEDAAKKLEHGVIVGKWSRKGYNKDISISFHISGFGRPPQLDAKTFDAIVEKAREQGIVFSHFYSYGALMRARCDYEVPEVVVPATA